jgi:heavy metal sensor kinase
MRSIRLSLVVYFLGLLVVALGVASLLAYRSARRALADKEEAMRENIQRKYDDRCREERDRLDKDLLEQAKALAGRVQVEFNWGRLMFIPNPDAPKVLVPKSLHVLGALTASAGPYGQVRMIPWLAQAHVPGWTTPLSPFLFTLWRSNVAELKLNHDFETPGSHAGDYFQIDVNHWGKPLRSKSLGDLSFPDPEDFGEGKVLHWEPDDFELAPGRWVRRVRVKASSARRSFIRPTPRRNPREDGPPMPMPVLPTSTPASPPTTEPARPRFRSAGSPPVFIVLQVAADRSKLTDALAKAGEERDEELAKLETRTALALAYLRNRLLAISSVTFTATVLGAWWLVWLGLLPLRRMSDAVSRVSPRDFRLPLEDAPMPRELRPIAERLTATLELLKRAFAREKQSTADISHELRTPLAAMLATTELALRKHRSPEQYREFIQECRFSAQQMNQIVERLLTLARLDAGVDRLRPRLVDVGELAEQCAAVVRPVAEANGLRLSVSTSAPAGEGGEGPRLTTDPDKLREVLNNLLHNAIQYNRPAGQIALSVARANECVRLEVRDTGIGIAPQVRDHIFERFYRADPSRNGDGMHAGLGLALVKEYVDLMGGRIAVESVEGQGSTFRVELPLASPAGLV